VSEADEAATVRRERDGYLRAVIALVRRAGGSVELTADELFAAEGATLHAEQGRCDDVWRAWVTTKGASER
jgi:hypothetical protein